MPSVGRRAATASAARGSFNSFRASSTAWRTPFSGSSSSFARTGAASFESHFARARTPAVRVAASFDVSRSRSACLTSSRRSSGGAKRNAFAACWRVGSSGDFRSARSWATFSATAGLTGFLTEWVEPRARGRGARGRRARTGDRAENQAQDLRLSVNGFAVVVQDRRLGQDLQVALLRHGDGNLGHRPGPLELEGTRLGPADALPGLAARTGIFSWSARP